MQSFEKFQLRMQEELMLHVQTLVTDGQNKNNIILLLRRHNYHFTIN